MFTNTKLKFLPVTIKLIIYIYDNMIYDLGFPCGSAGKESACNVGELGLILGLGRLPGEGKGYPLQYSGLEKPVDCNSPRGPKESDTDTTERLSLSQLNLLYISVCVCVCVCARAHGAGWGGASQVPQR